MFTQPRRAQRGAKLSTALGRSQEGCGKREERLVTGLESRPELDTWQEVGDQLVRLTE